jgi:uncharacterized protein YcfJ
MNTLLRLALGAAGTAMAAQAAAQVTFYERDRFEGRSYTATTQVSSLEKFGFNDRASSVVVSGQSWEVCEDARYSGRCVILRPGQYDSLAAMGLNDRISSARTVSGNARVEDTRYAPAPAGAQVTFYEHENFAGRSFTADGQVADLQRDGFNDRASSAVVSGAPWEVCDDAQFRGRCLFLRPGRYPSLGSMNLNDRLSSARVVSGNMQIDDNRYASAPAATHDYRRHHNERIHEANVTSVRAVLGTPEQRCWVEREQISQERSQANVPGAILGAVIGGILGHQVGGGRGQDIATVGGAVAGAAVGANVGRSSGQQSYSQDVQRCENVSGQARPDYWDVTYNFRGVEHRVQMTAPPGPTVSVNEQGEPRA